jgi:glycosyltransferase involved in cell wall biosynthesis
MNMVTESILAPAVQDGRVILNGVDLNIFRPLGKNEAKKSLGWDPDTPVILLSAKGIRSNPWKDYGTLIRSLEQIGSGQREEKLRVVALGDDGPGKRFGNVELQFEPFRAQPREVACFYQAADLCVHAAKADTFPNVVLEALACGTPVVATAVGGIPEQVKPMDWPGHAPGCPSEPFDGATGALVAPGDPEAMAHALTMLLKEHELRRRMGENAVRDAGRRFDLDRQVSAYLEWFMEIIEPEAKARAVG